MKSTIQNNISVIEDYMDTNKCTTCKRCGRRLKTKQSIQLGMGTICYKRYMDENNHKKLWKFPEQI